VDIDGDVDLRDVAGLQACAAPPGPVGFSCEVFDYDADGRVGAADYARFTAALTGPQ
jgi:hypothetical protein